MKPVHVSAEYYYQLPVRRFYKTYPIYHPSKEPKPEGKNYIEWLKAQKPEEILHDFSALKTEADWFASGPALGKDVFEAPIGDETNPFLTFARLEDVRDPTWYEKTGVQCLGDGVMPYMRYVVTPSGLRVGTFSCAMCHTRVERLPDGKKIVIGGAQGNFPFDRVGSEITRRLLPAGFEERRTMEEEGRRITRLLFDTPWLTPNPQELQWKMSLEESLALFDAIPPGVLARHGTGGHVPVQVPDLIGIKEMRYLDRTGLVRHREIGDLMRYGSLNQGIDFLDSFGGFIPAGKDFKELPDPKNPPPELGGGRYSDEQLYAMALYIYSLEPPANPHMPKTKDDEALVAQGKAVFDRDGCASCHEPPAYTNNKFTRAAGYKVPADHPEKANILTRSADAEPTLATKTRRGTGLYKVPSLKGVWYRGPFEHNGSVATLEDWFDPKRLDDDYVPTGWKGPPGTKTRAVQGHEFGLDLTAHERRDLIAFLKTL